eukprot:m.69464 g.69464  ORF g.69464 m.69464 type:complete len:595 (-) comp7551_c0_seq2:2510-4294(-)
MARCLSVGAVRVSVAADTAEISENIRSGARDVRCTQVAEALRLVHANLLDASGGSRLARLTFRTGKLLMPLLQDPLDASLTHLVCQELSREDGRSESATSPLAHATLHAASVPSLAASPDPFAQLGDIVLELFAASPNLRVLEFVHTVGIYRSSHTEDASVRRLSIPAFLDATAAGGRYRLADAVAAMPNLEQLHFNTVAIPLVGVRALAAGCALASSLTLLTLASVGVGSAGLHALAVMLADNKTITRLDLSWNELTADDDSVSQRKMASEQPASEQPANQSRAASRARRQYGGMRMLGTALARNTALKSLTISFCDLGRAIHHISTGLLENKSLHELVLDGNRLPSKHTVALCQAIGQHPTLTDVSMKEIRLVDERVCLALVAMITAAPALQALDISYLDRLPNASPPAIRDILSAAQQKSTLILLEVENIFLDGLGDALFSLVAARPDMQVSIDTPGLYSRPCNAVISMGIAAASWPPDTYVKYRTNLSRRTATVAAALRREPDDVDESGCTALHVAARDYNGDACRMLLARGFQRNRRDLTGCTPLHYAASRRLSHAICHALLGAPPSNQPGDPLLRLPSSEDDLWHHVR